MKLLRTCSIALTVALALLMVVQAGVFAFIEQLPPGELTARADTVSMGKAPDITTSKEGQGGDFASAKQLTSAAAWTSDNTSLKELVNGADSVIAGTVVERSSYWNDEHTGIYTSVVLSVEERLKGTASQDRIIITYPGGEVDGLGQWVSNMPNFDQGEKAVVFLKKLSKEQIPKVKDKEQLSEEQFEVYGGFRGKFAIKQGIVGNLTEAEFKEKVEKVIQGQVLSVEELDIPSSPVTFPYLYGGFCWPHPPNPVVNYRINENTADCTGEGAAVQSAAATWNAAGAKFSFNYAGTSTATTYNQNYVNEILWIDLGIGGPIARAITWYIVSTGTIVENDMEFNDYHTWSTAATPPSGQYDTQTIALHEFGHFLNLSDLYSPADSAKVMYGYGSTGTTKRALHADDIAGIQSIYGVLPVAPTVTNYNGASNIIQTSARLNGEVTSIGSENPTVHIYWGLSNGGTTPSSWANDVNLGIKATGTFYTDLSNLTAGSTYYYRCYAVNSAGGSWASSTTSFATLSDPVPPTIEAIAEAEGQYYNTVPVFSNFGFDDDVALDDGWYQMDSFGGAWTTLFTDVPGTSWDNDNWTIPGFGALSEGPHTIYFKASDDASNIEGESGEWSWQFYKDTVAPNDPTNVVSTSHSTSTWSGDNTIDISWTDATDVTSGPDGYSILWDTSAATVPDAVKDIENGVQTTTSPTLADGNSHYFHIRSVDNAGNWQSTVHLGPFFINASLPTMEAIAEAEGQYYNTMPVFSNFGFDDDVALDDGWYQMDSFGGAWTTLFTDVPGTSWDNDNWTILVFGALSEGPHTIYFKASDDATNVQGESGELSWQFYKDTDPPNDPTSVNSTSHIVSVWSSDNTVDITWTDATDNLSGLDGYSILWDTSVATVPDAVKDIEEGSGNTTSSVLVDGSSHYFHIRSVDNAGNWQSTIHLGPFFIETVPPTDPTSVNSTSHSLSTWSSNNTVAITWTDATDATSGLDGYSILWDTANSTVPDAVKDIEDSSENTTSSELASGNNHYFHIRSVDNASNWQSTVHLGPFYIDTMPPTDPTSINSANHSLSTWSSDNIVDVSWTDATDNLSGLDGYSILWDTSASTTPSANKTIEEGIGSTTSSELADGNSHYFHIRSVDSLGNWQSTAHLGPFYIAVDAPFLTNGTVSPGSGYTSATFTFSVNYTDFKDDAPISITITIDSTTTANMTAVTGQDGDFTNGEIYEYSVLGSSLSLGSHNFQFAASDGTDTAIGDTGSHSGPTVSSKPSGGGSGGGGGGGGGGAGITPVRPYMRDNKFTEDVSARSEDFKVEIYLPEGTVALNAIGASISSIRIQVNAEPPLRPKDTSTVTLVYEMGPAGATFDPPVDLTMEYDESKIPEGVAEKTLVVATYDDGTGQWTDLESTVDTENDTVTAKVSHFSAFAVLAYTRPASFTITDLTVIPEEIELGETVSVSVLVTNDGNLAGSYEASLKIDDLLVQTKEVSLAGGDAETISFSITPDTAGEHMVNVGGSTGTYKVEELKAPAEFSASDLTISPVELLTGGRVTISITLINTGGLSGSYDVSLKIDGVQIETKKITLDAGKSQKVVFVIIPDAAGTYSVDIEGLSGSFVVQELATVSAEEEKMAMPAPAAVTPALAPSPEPTPSRQINWWAIAGIFFVIAVAGYFIFFIRKKKEME